MPRLAHPQVGILARQPMISQHISLADAVRSQTAERKGIQNIPNPEQLECMKVVARQCYEPLWLSTGGCIRVSSFFRSQLLNKAVGGSSTSQHMKGQAIDMEATGKFTNGQLMRLAEALPSFDQLISEFGTEAEPAWIHISYVSPTKNRRQVLRIGK